MPGVLSAGFVVTSRGRDALTARMTSSPASVGVAEQYRQNKGQYDGEEQSDRQEDEIEHWLRPTADTSAAPVVLRPCALHARWVPEIRAPAPSVHAASPGPIMREMHDRGT